MHSLEKSAQFTAVIPAAGASRRMGGQDKLLLSLRGKPVIAWTLETFQKCSHIGDIILVTSPWNFSTFSEIIHTYKINKTREIVQGGEDRRSSVYNGLKCVRTKYVAVHDGARPLLSAELLENLINEALRGNSCVPGIPARDTVKVVGADEVVSSTPPRKQVRLIQTPQLFETQVLLHAYKNAMEKGIEATDEASLVEILGGKVIVVPGDPVNVKITTPLDAQVAAMYMKEFYRQGDGAL